MTLAKLSQYYQMQMELANYDEMLAALEARAGPRTQLLTGMPHASGVRDAVGDLAVEIADLKNAIKELEVEAEREAAEVEAFVTSIQDVPTRMIFRLRFIRCMTWKEVADMMGGGNTEGSVQKVCYRYLKATEGKG